MGNYILAPIWLHCPKCNRDIDDFEKKDTGIILTMFSDGSGRVYIDCPHCNIKIEMEIQVNTVKTFEP